MSAWWREGVLYQIYPRSFRDGDGDGHGDLAGILQRLDHLQWLGVDGIWLNPTMPSPDADWGYDVADYTGVHPDFGTLADLDALIAAAGERGIRVLLDLVPNHTSEAHPWFLDACSGRDAEHRGFYVWADGDPSHPPTNWRGTFGGSAWTWHAPTGQWYLHNFLPSQPDLNWWDERVPAAFDAILACWLRRGVAGFRIDVCQALVHDRELRDDPPDGHGGLVQRYSMNRPEGHDALRRLRRTAQAEGGDDALLVGETYVDTVEQVLSFYGDGTDELGLAFNVPFVKLDLAAEPMRANVEAVEADLPGGAWPVWTGSNHDDGRLATRWAGGNEALARCALVMLLTLRGTPVLYYGDELALPDVPVPADRVRDTAGGRDGCRTPMPWTAQPGAGFTDDPEAEPWLPLGDRRGRDVAAQRADPGSTLQLVRDLIALRRAEPELRCGAYATLPAPAGAWAWTRGDGWAVALNLDAAGPVRIAGLDGEVALATDRARDGERVDGTLTVRPGEGAVMRLARDRAVLEPPEQAVAQLQQLASGVPRGRSLVDELLAERRVER